MGTSQLDQTVARCETLLAQCLVAANQAAAAAASIGTAGLAPLASPAFTGAPTAPTPPVGDASTRLATTAFLGSQLGQPSGIATLDSGGLIPLAQLPFAGLTYKGTWNAATNSPTLHSGSGTGGNFYLVAVSGSTTLDGISSWAVGDQALFSGTAWSKVPYTAPPLSNIPLASLEGIAAGTFVGNTGGGSASPAAISLASISAYLATMVGDTGSGGSRGLVPAPPAGATGSGAFLSAAGTWLVPTGPNLAAYALIASPAFTGTATAATQTRGVISSALATGQYVVNNNAQSTEAAIIKVNGTASAGSSTYAAAIDHIHGTDLSRAAASNPSFAGTGAITGNWTVGGALAAATAVISGTLTAAAISVAALAALASMTLSGTATITGAIALGGTATTTTQGTGVSSTLLATTAFVKNCIGTLTPGATYTFGSGLTLSGSAAGINLNNQGGIGSYGLFVVSTPVLAGATFSPSTFASFNTTGNLVNGANSATGTWRNMNGDVVTNGGCLAMRIS